MQDNTRLVCAIIGLCIIVYFMAGWIDELRWQISIIERRQFERDKRDYYAQTNGLKDAQE